MFLSLGLHDVLIHTLPASISASRTLIIEPVHRQRSIKTIITSKSSDNVKSSSTANAADSSLPYTTIVSEIVPRRYHSKFAEKHSPMHSATVTNQYLKAWQQQYDQGNHEQIHFNFLINKISLSFMDELNDICLFREILCITIDKVNLLFYQRFIDIEPYLYQQQFFCSIEQLQIDNQCYSSKANYDFPVVLMSKAEKHVSKAKTNVHVNKKQLEYVSLNYN